MSFGKTRIYTFADLHLDVNIWLLALAGRNSLKADSTVMAAEFSQVGYWSGLNTLEGGYMGYLSTQFYCQSQFKRSRNFALTRIPDTVLLWYLNRMNGKIDNKILPIIELKSEVKPESDIKYFAVLP